LHAALPHSSTTAEKSKEFIITIATHQQQEDEYPTLGPLLITDPPPITGQPWFVQLLGDY
jgi:hypothetical protein